jgi:hypothetical protein
MVQPFKITVGMDELDSDKDGGDEKDEANLESEEECCIELQH